MDLENQTTFSLWDISSKYQRIHGWLSLAVCIFGLISHIINMIVLTRKNMIRRETNIILLAISISNFLVLTTTTPYLIHFYIIHRDKSIFIPDPERDTKAWTIFLKTHIMSSVTFHTISVWLTVYLSCFRFFYLSSLMPHFGSPKPTKQKWLNISFIKSMTKYIFLKQNRMVMSIVSAFVFGFLFCLPVFFYSSIKENFDDSNNQSEPIKYYYLEQSDINFITNDFIFKFMLYGQVIFTKLIPCSLIFLFTSLIIYKLIAKSRIENKLFNHDRRTKRSVNESTRINLTKKPNNIYRSNKRKGNKSDAINLPLRHYQNVNSISKPKNSKPRKNVHYRTTIMLILVCALFLIVEFPVTVLTILSISMNDQFYYDFYVPCVEVMDLIVLIYPSINLILYCSMGSVFRRNVLKLFKESWTKSIFCVHTKYAFRP